MSDLVTLTQWQAYLESLDPSRIELGLERVRGVFNTLDLSIQGKVIVVGGTNGKGSTVAALQALLMNEGGTVGSYVSPHLQNFNERICYQGVPVSDDELIDAFQRVEIACAETTLTYFEFITLAAIVLLAQKSPDYLIFEVGLGGRLDAVNILDADIAIVTGVALDHTDWLGTDLESIGGEKAGIYRANKPAIYASPDCPHSILAKIAEIGARPYIFGKQLLITESSKGGTYKIFMEDQTCSITLSDLNLPNASVLSALSAFAFLGFELNDNLQKTLSKVSLPGRYQKVLLGKTTCILDVAHNAQAASYLAQRIAADLLNGCWGKSPGKKPVAVVGAMSDKVLEDIFDPMLGVVEQWLLVQPNTPRAATLDQQRQVLVRLGVNSNSIISVGSVSAIKDHLAEIEAAVVFGSFYTVGEFLDVLDSSS